MLESSLFTNRAARPVLSPCAAMLRSPRLGIRFSSLALNLYSWVERESFPYYLPSETSVYVPPLTQLPLHYHMHHDVTVVDSVVLLCPTPPCTAYVSLYCTHYHILA